MLVLHRLRGQSLYAKKGNIEYEIVLVKVFSNQVEFEHVHKTNDGNANKYSCIIKEGTTALWHLPSIDLEISVLKISGKKIKIGLGPDDIKFIRNEIYHE